MRDSGESRTRSILCPALEHFSIGEEDLIRAVRGDLTRAAVAACLFEETPMCQKWISNELGMKSAPNVCQQIRRFRAPPKKKLPGKLRKLTNLNNF